MNILSLSERTPCFHCEKRVVERASKGFPFDKRPDLIIWICHFPLASLSGIQCPVVARNANCPHDGPYSDN